MLGFMSVWRDKAFIPVNRNVWILLKYSGVLCLVECDACAGLQRWVSLRYNAYDISVFIMDSIKEYHSLFFSVLLGFKYNTQ